MGVAPSGKAQLMVSSLSPPSLRGSGFRPGENVTVRMREGASKGTKRVRANASGSFVVRYPALPAGDCGGMNVTAAGDKGSRAGVRVLPVRVRRTGRGLLSSGLVRLGHRAVVERLVERLLVDAGLAGDLA